MYFIHSRGRSLWAIGAFCGAWLLLLPALPKPLLAQSADRSQDSAAVYGLLRAGQEIYEQRQGYQDFRNSLYYFDSAQAIADRSGDTLLMAEAVFARGRVYDAWNKAPHRTVALFRQAADLFRHAGKEQRYYYAKHLEAHAYDKMKDSVGATTLLRALLADMQQKDTFLLRQMPFAAEMALIATEVRAYGLADSILTLLTRRAWIANDSDTYDYLDHYYLTRSRLDIYGARKRHSPYLDSLARAYANARNLLDKIYYSANLAMLYGEAGQYRKSWQYGKAAGRLGDSLESSHELEAMQQALVQSEITAERRRLEFQNRLRQNRVYAVWVLSALLVVITVLSLYLYRRNQRYKAQSRHLRDLNQQLDSHAMQVELLNKEIQHRIKNNLYTIYSLLHMQEESTDNEEVIAHLQAARMRVESIAQLHSQLIGGNESVDFGVYVKGLILKIVSCLASDRRVVTHINAGPVSLPLNAYFALSLILNEWITNSIKYAQPAGDVLEIDVCIITAGDQVTITYQDSGSASGQPPRVAKDAGLGSEIVELLTAQIKGRLSRVNGRPYHYHLSVSQ